MQNDQAHSCIDCALPFQVLAPVLLQDGLTLWNRLFENTLRDLAGSNRSGVYLERPYRHLRMV